MQNYGYSGGMNSRHGGNQRSGGMMNYGPQSRGMYDQDDGYGMGNDNYMGGGNYYGRYGQGNDNFPSMNRGRFNQMNKNMFDDDMFMDSRQGPPNRNPMSSNSRFGSDFYDNGPQRRFSEWNDNEMPTPRRQRMNEMFSGNWGNEELNFVKTAGPSRNRGPNFRSDITRGVLPQSRQAFKPTSHRKKRKGKSKPVSQGNADKGKPATTMGDDDKEDKELSEKTFGPYSPRAKMHIMCLVCRTANGCKANYESHLKYNSHIYTTEKLIKRYVGAAALLSEHLKKSYPSLIKRHPGTCSVCNVQHNNNALHRWSIRHQTRVFYEHLFSKKRGTDISLEQLMNIQSTGYKTEIYKDSDKPGEQPEVDAENVDDTEKAMEVAIENSELDCTENQTNETLGINGDDPDGLKPLSASFAEEATKADDDAEPLGKELVVPVKGFICHQCHAFFPEDENKYHCKSRKHREIYLRGFELKEEADFEEEQSAEVKTKEIDDEDDVLEDQQAALVESSAVENSLIDGEELNDDCEAPTMESTDVN